jgi:predicted nuclease of restriction endonuclease-like RecB superfamily
LLTADLVNVRRKGRELRIVPLDPVKRERAIVLAAAYLELARAHVGRSRDELEEACAAVEAGPQERRLADGLCKLVEDRCEFDQEEGVDPEELRREIFSRASLARYDGTFDRRRLVATMAAERKLTPDAVERALYADLRGAHALKSVDPIAPARLVEAYDLAQAQAVLLRAVHVTVDVECRAPGAYRALFHKLKFLRLLYSIEPRAAGGYRIDIDGPFSLFESVTKYGLQLALALPAIRACDAWTLTAELRWGKERVPLTLRLEGQSSASTADADPPRLADEVTRLIVDLAAIETPWRVSPATDILNLPGAGLCVPDLVFQHAESGECVYLEVLGFWSRQAVWRRVELVERGLPQRILFAVSQRLRVSEEVLGDDLPGALYVYKRVMSARTILERIELLASRMTTPA